MGERDIRNIIITGFSYTGKTQVSRIVAERMGWDLLDTDEEIVRIAGKPIPEIFAQDGEPHFRKLERQALANVCRRRHTVIATGGGIVTAAENREMMRASGMIVCLEADPETIHRRLLIDSEKADRKVIRPLLAVEDPLGRIRSLKASRQLFYDEADWTVRTDHLTPDEVAAEIIRGWHYLCRRMPQAASGEAAAVVITPTESYPIFIGWHILETLGERMKKAGLSGEAYIVSDDRVFPLYGPKVKASLENAGFGVDSLVVPSGETSKSLAVAGRMYDFLVRHRAERFHAIVALGGGMVGDLAGFVAATFLRGMPLVHVPTSLIAMVDSSIGGKTAVNHPEGKNLIGAFHQPRLVLADVETLATLPPRELTSGWAEVIKHALIRDAEYFRFLEGNAEGLARLDPEAATEAIRRSAAIKAEIVSADEKETSGLRTLLNYGHTIAHGLETAAGYGHLLHGEAVAVGMGGAASIAHRLGILHRNAAERQKALIEKFGLPTACPGIDPDDVLRAIEMDKKVRMKAVRWVLLQEIGKPIIRNDVPADLVQEVIAGLVNRGKD